MALDDLLRRAAAAPGPLVVLTGAGISAESGIPTFRGPGGFWTVGSRHYQPEEMATQAMFSRHPEAVWGWYLYRRGLCAAARPNPAHTAVVTLERALGARFVLLTQNVDGLHLEAGSSPERTLQIHGNLHRMRCASACSNATLPVPAALGPRPGGEPVTPVERALLCCPACGEWTRPHVLWFDETYDESHYRYETALRAASEATLLLVVGTSGATSLPMHVAGIAAERGAALVDVDPEPNPFAALATRTGGVHVAERAASALPGVVARCCTAFAGRST